MNLISTLKGSLLENFFPEGWDLAKIDACCANPPESITERQSWWNKKFAPVPCETVADFDMMMGHEIALTIKQSKDAGEEIIFILPVGPMGMYRWAVYFLTEWDVDCKHVHGFNMDEWSDEDGNTLAPSDPGAFQNAMQDAFYGPLRKLTVPKKQRHFATKISLPKYGEQIGELRSKGARLVVVFGIGRVMHIAFWEPHFAAEYKSVEEWKKPTHRIGAKLHPLTIEQNAITSFKSRTTLVPCRANTIGPGLFLGADKIIGGCDGALNRGMMWQGLSLWVTLRHGPSPWIPSSFMPTQAGKLFFLTELAGPLAAECN
ncbi:MAG: glucosamine-6-phosphate isomerase [Armatimonadetes bacterium CG2_30_59_28]|nr:glucosamine-6-phosphate isomerase [Armatimonadota bacterium]OIO96583.1 MAG: glucosamine-6-phosphate isomerase [Armatimonadetes bacterium CG2_30_59_28]PIU61481.1 MAG: glucosamine-6-phosphate isomerase [Armatimonadetes bacterium CG07_land_8_20_14_0_80_59_28]PIX42803.1 MAG: glucosamine-6-phosphate isomerase [Armatimonadetes bacterium CG_4_8_14_3_um_filter_58_9]PIY44426.1 MAG: glucosamine-6-phosphate isomerase [Armatimonadetes bacterium CG_4_10_14_3_um_filter_59_10]PJB63625.1 MAG: glucosamine-6